MKLPVKNKPFTWSPSALKSFNTCPVQYWGKYCDPNKIKEPQTEAMLWGIDVHKAFELCVVQDQPKLPERFKVYQKWLDAVRGIPGWKVPEQKVAFNRFWEPVEFFAPDAWLRLIVDLTVTQLDRERGTNDGKGVVLDYKTGKSRYDNEDQLKLSSIELLKHPDLNSVRAGYIYLKEDHSTFMMSTREQVENYKQEFETKIEPMVEAYTTGIFNPKPSGLCKKWCNVKRCPHNG